MWAGPPVRKTSKYSALATAVSALTSGHDIAQPSTPAKPSAPAAKAPAVSAIAAAAGPAPSCLTRAAAVAA